MNLAPMELLFYCIFGEPLIIRRVLLRRILKSGVGGLFIETPMALQVSSAPLCGKLLQLCNNDSAHL